MPDLPSPPLPADVDLRDFAFMPLDVVRLRDSDIAALTSGDEFRAAVMLWCAAWHQIPAASIPDDDIVLARLSGYGRVVKEWQKVREGALRGWVKCSDGRLYHPVITEKAVEAWESKQAYRAKKEADRLRKQQERSSRRGKTGAGNPPENGDLSDGHGDEFQRTGVGNPPENALIGIGTGTVDRDRELLPTEEGSSVLSPGGVQNATSQGPTRAGVLCRKLREHSIDAAPHMPVLLDLLGRFSDEEIIAVAEIAKERKPSERIHLNYLVPILNDQSKPQQTGSTKRRPAAENFDSRDYGKGGKL